MNKPKRPIWPVLREKEKMLFSNAEELKWRKTECQILDDGNKRGILKYERIPERRIR